MLSQTSRARLRRAYRDHQRRMVRAVRKMVDKSELCYLHIAGYLAIR